MNDNQKQTSDRIETVLAALHNAQPAPGMEQRITAALLRARGEASTKPSRWTWLRTPQLAFVAAVLVAGVLLSSHTYRRHHPGFRRSAFYSDSARARPLSQDEALQQASIKPARHSGRTAPATMPAHASVLDVSRLPAQNRARADLKAAREGSLQAEGTQVEQGFPAPPLPLTEQERLLVRLIHRDDPVQLSQLTPAAREAELQRDREQVSEFFKPPPMLAANFKLEPYPTTEGTQ